MAYIYALLYILALVIINILRGQKFENESKKDSTGRILDTITGKTPLSLLLGCISWWYFSDYIIGIIIAVGYRAWAMPGWGLYLTALHGDYRAFFQRDEYGEVYRRNSGRVVADSEIAPLDWLADIVTLWFHGIKLRDKVAEGLNTGTLVETYNGKPLKELVHRWGLYAMTARALLWCCVFIPVGVYAQNYLIPLYALLCALGQGYSYYGLRAHHNDVASKLYLWVQNGKVGKQPVDYTVTLAEALTGLTAGILLVVTKYTL